MKTRRARRALHLTLTAAAVSATLLLTLATACGDGESQSTWEIGGVITDAEAEAALEGVQITAEPSTMPVFTDATGAYTFGGEYYRPIAYTIIAEADGYHATRSDKVQLRPDGVFAVDLALEMRRISGIVLDEDGAPVKGARATLVGVDDVEVFTDETGAFSFEPLQAKGTSFTVKVDGEGFQPWTQNGVKVEAGINPELDVVLER